MKAVLLDESKFLILKQVVGEKEFWDLPGGRVQYGETPFQTLIREVKEETSLEITPLRPLGVWWFTRMDKKQVVCTTFLCSFQGTVDTSNNVDDEFLTDHRWVTKEDFLKEEYLVGDESLKRLIKESL